MSDEMENKSEAQLFEEGFNIGNDDASGQNDTGQADNSADDTDSENQAGASTHDDDSGQQTAEQENNQAQQQQTQQQSAPLYFEQQQNFSPINQQYAQQQAMQQQQVQQVAKVAIPEDMREEFERLKAISPEAAALAEEDSPQGKVIRDRLEEYGANLALDRAEQTLQQRRMVQEEQARREYAQQEQARRFRETIQRDHPQIAAMAADPNRQEEAAAYTNAILEWIGTKPYNQGVHLAHVARFGNEQQVSQLITQFESERNAAKSKRPDPTGAFAVHGRGAPVAPTGLGDKDSFDDGWLLNESEK